MDNNSDLTRELIQTFQQFQNLGFKPADINIRPSETKLLYTLTQMISKDIENINITDLSLKLDITPAAVTHMTDSLVLKGYVERHNSIKDRRIVLIKPTREGLIIIQSMREDFYNKCKALTDFLGEDNTKELVRLMSITNNYLKNK